MKIIAMLSCIWCSALVAGGIPPEQLSSHVRVGVVASREAHALSHVLEPIVLKRAQDQAQKIAYNKDGMIEPEALGRCCNDVVQGFSGELQKGIKKSRSQTQLIGSIPSTQCLFLGGDVKNKERDLVEQSHSLISSDLVTPGASFSAATMHKIASTGALVCAKDAEKERKEDRDAPTQLCKRVSMSGALEPYCAYRFDTDTVRRPISCVTSGSYVVYSALALKNLWEKHWSHEQPSGERDIYTLVKEKSALVQAHVKKMVEKHGEQKGPQIYVTDEMLREMLTHKTFENTEPYNNIFMLSQEKKLMLVKTTPEFELWGTHEEVEGQAEGETQKLLSFLARCTQPKEEACACIIDTFINKPGPMCDHVLAFVSKKAGEQGPVFIYMDPLNRGMKKNPRAYMLLSFLLNQARASRSMPEEKGLLGKFLDSVHKRA
jgi:hypothetical protein